MYTLHVNTSNQIQSIINQDFKLFSSQLGSRIQQITQEYPNHTTFENSAMTTNPFNVAAPKKAKNSYKNPFGIEVSESNDSDITNDANELWGKNFSDVNVVEVFPEEEQQSLNPQPVARQSLNKQQNLSTRTNPFSEETSALDINFSLEYPNGQQPQAQHFNQQNPKQRESIQALNQQHLGFDPNYVDPDNEPPLLVELGIDLNSIKLRAISVLKFSKCDVQLLEDPDMSGPIILCFLFGILLLLSGKLHFGYIYGFGISGTLTVYSIMNFLSMVIQRRNAHINHIFLKKHKEIPLYNTLSILGYCLMPVIILSFFNVFFNFNKGLIGGIFSFFAILWSTAASTNFFVELMSQSHQKYLIAYPIFLFYSIFVLITIF